MRRTVVIAGVVGVVLWLAAGCARDAGGDAGRQRLVVTGSSTIAPLAATLAERFEAQHPGIRVDVQAGGSTRGIHDVRTGLADIGLVSRALTSAETDLHAYPIARDGIALIVHADNPVTGLTGTAVEGLFTGWIDDWSKLGGTERPVTVVHKAEGHSTLELFLEHFGLDRQAVRADVVAGHNQQVIKTVVANPGAVGYVSIGAAAHEAARGAPIRLLPLDGVPATLAEVGARRYPLVRTLNFVTRGPATGVAGEFIEFARSENVRDLVAAQQHVVATR